MSDSEIECQSEAVTIVALSVGDFVTLRYEYMNTIRAILEEYLSSDKARVTKYRNQMKRAAVSNFGSAFELGFEDGGGGDYRENHTADDNAWLAAKQQAEMGFIDLLFQDLGVLKGEGVDAWTGEPERRAESYARTLDGVYNEGRMRGARDKMLTFGGDDGEESCRTCQKMKGKRHKASWWIRHRMIPGQPGNTSYECCGWNCRHYLYDDQGNLFTF